MGSPGLAGLLKTHLLTGPATPRPGQLPPPGPAGLGPPQQIELPCCQSSDRKMEALKGWLQLHSAGLLEVSGKARQIVTESQSFVQQRFATLLDQCQFSDLTKQCQQFLVKLSQQIRNGHLPLEYLIVGGVLLALTVLAFLYRRSRLKAAAASGEGKEQKGASNAKRPEPEGREEPRPGSGSGGRVWKKPLGVKPQQGKVEEAPPKEQPWRKKCAPKPVADAEPKKPATQAGKFQLSQPLEHVERVPEKKSWFGKQQEKEEEPQQKTGWFSSTSNEKKVEEPAKKSSWFGSKSETKEEETPKKSSWSGSKSNGVQKSETPAWKKRAQIDEAEEQRKFEEELAEIERKTVEKTKSSLKAPRLNIEKNPRPLVESKKQKEVEVMLVKQLCGAYKAEVKLDEKAAAAREEKKKDLEVVRSARSFFKTVDKQRSESMSAVPRIRFRTEEEVSDSYTRGNTQRLSQFEPGKINSKCSNIFGHTSQECAPNVRPPKKKLITLDEVLRTPTDAPPTDLEAREAELRVLAAARKNWVPPEDERMSSSALREEISSLNSTPVKARWQQTMDGVKERPRSMDVHKLDVSQVFNNENKSVTGSNQDISKELEEIRDSRPTPVTKRWRPPQQTRETGAARSQSAHSLRRTRLPDDAWVVERSASRLEEERLKAVQELEEVKKARQETLEVIENGELERPSSRAEAENRTKALRELEEVKLVQLSHEKRVQDSYKKSDGNAAEKAKEEIYRETIASQRRKRERFESQSKDGGKSSERDEIADLTMEDIALAIAMESLEDIDGILNRLNQPDSEDTDIENLKSEMETLVDKAEQIEANLENIEHIDQQVQIVVNNYDEEDNENSLDDEVQMITSDIGESRGKGLSGFEPGRISDNFMKRFDSPSVNDEVPVFRPKKKLLSFDQVMRRTPSSSDDVRQQRDMELDEVRNVRKSWCPPDESELSFNKISKSATVPDRLKITSVYCNDKRSPLADKEERSQELLELRQSRSGDVRKAMKGDSSWVREKTSHGGERSRTQAELAALREARSTQMEELDPLYSTRQELEEKARLQR